MTSDMTSIGSEWRSVGSDRGRNVRELKSKGKPKSTAEVFVNIGRESEMT